MDSREATFHPATDDRDDTYPAIELAGVWVFLYVEDGMVRVSVDLDTTIPELTHGSEQIVPLHITVQGTTVYYTDPRG